jgi:phosphate transport system ATP-binding protein
MDKIIIDHLSLRYSDGAESLRDIHFNIPANKVAVLFGPAGGGKSTLLRTLNRLNDLGDVAQVEGQVLFNGQNILDPQTDVVQLRRKIGMVFSRPVPLPLTISQNISYGLEIAGERRKSRLNEAVERTLRQVALWDEVYDRLDAPAIAISGGQQQRLCIARVLALNPEVILLDEPFKDHQPRFGFGRKFSVSTFSFQCGKKALHNRVVVAIPSAAHADAAVRLLNSLW